jgi:hypothetical protein
MVEGRRPSGKIFQQVVQLLLEIIALHEAQVCFGKLSQGLHKRLGHKEAAVLGELDCGFFGYQTMQRITGLYLLYLECTN